MEILTPITRPEEKAYEAILEYKPESTYDLKRLAEAVRLYNSSVEKSMRGEDGNDGIYGCVKELFKHRPASTITRVRKHGLTDCYVLIDEKRRKLEIKTNGGEVDNFLEWSVSRVNATYINVDLYVDVKPSRFNPDGVRKLDVIMPLAHWIMRMQEAQAIKPQKSRSNTHRNVLNVRADSKKMYMAFVADLNDINEPVWPFDRHMCYIGEDF